MNRVPIKVRFSLWLIDRKLKKEAPMLAALFGNWRTTILGIIAGAIQLHQGGMSWGNAALAAAMAALGLMAKDAKTGSQPQ